MGLTLWPIVSPYMPAKGDSVEAEDRWSAFWCFWMFIILVAQPQSLCMLVPSNSMSACPENHTGNKPEDSADFGPRSVFNDWGTGGLCFAPRAAFANPRTPFPDYKV